MYCVYSVNSTKLTRLYYIKCILNFYLRKKKIFKIYLYQRFCAFYTFRSKYFSPQRKINLVPPSRLKFSIRPWFLYINFSRLDTFVFAKTKIGWNLTNNTHLHLRWKNMVVKTEIFQWENFQERDWTEAVPSINYIGRLDVSYIGRQMYGEISIR